MIEVTSILVEYIVSDFIKKLPGSAQNNVSNAVKAIKAQLADRRAERADFAAISPDGELVMVVEAKRYIGPPRAPTR